MVKWFSLAVEFKSWNNYSEFLTFSLRWNINFGPNVYKENCLNCLKIFIFLLFCSPLMWLHQETLGGKTTCKQNSKCSDSKKVHSNSNCVMKVAEVGAGGGEGEAALYNHKFSKPGTCSGCFPRLTKVVPPAHKHPWSSMAASQCYGLLPCTLQL